MDSVKRRAILMAMIDKPQTSDADRLRALALLGDLDEREKSAPPPLPQPDPDPVRMAKLTDLLIEYGLLDAIPAFQAKVEIRALEIVEARDVEASAAA